MTPTIFFCCLFKTRYSPQTLSKPSLALVSEWFWHSEILVLAGLARISDSEDYLLQI